MSLKSDDDEHFTQVSLDETKDDTPRKRKMEVGTRFKFNSKSPKTDVENAPPQTVIVGLVKPQRGKKPIEGAAVGCLSYMMDHHSTHLLYVGRNGDDYPKKKKFLDDTGIVPRVVYMKDANGDNLCKNAKGRIFQTKSVVISFEDMRKETLRDWLDDVFAPSIWNNVEQKYDDKVMEKDLPKIQSDDDYFEVDSWDQVLQTTQDIEFVANHFTNRKLYKWLKEDDDHLYNLFEEGNVPFAFMRKYKIKFDDLRPKDQKRVLESNEKAKKPQAAKKTDG